MTRPATGALPFIAPAPDHRQQFEVACTHRRRRAGHCRRPDLRLDSSFSHERGGWNTLSATGEASGEDSAWSVQTGVAVAAAVTASRHYRIERLVTVHDEHVEVADTITNTRPVTCAAAAP